jgi:hypothetical protein
MQSGFLASTTDPVNNSTPHRPAYKNTRMNRFGFGCALISTILSTSFVFFLCEGYANAINMLRVPSAFE